MSDEIENTGSSFGYSLADERQGGSGDRDLDAALAHTLLKLSDEFGVLPTFSFFDESKGANAYASARSSDSSRFGSVMYGRLLLAKQRKQYRQFDAHIAAVCAHEFAHIVQFKRNTNDALVAGTGTVRRAELHADYLAGWFAGFRKRQNSDFPAAEVALSQFSVGDRQRTHPEHHGTPEERGTAVVEGFSAAQSKLSFAEAFEQGLRWARTM